MNRSMWLSSIDPTRIRSRRSSDIKINGNRREFHVSSTLHSVQLTVAQRQHAGRARWHATDRPLLPCLLKHHVAHCFPPSSWTLEEDRSPSRLFGWFRRADPRQPEGERIDRRDAAAPPRSIESTAARYTRSLKAFPTYGPLARVHVRLLSALAAGDPRCDSSRPGDGRPEIRRSDAEVPCPSLLFGTCLRSWDTAPDFLARSCGQSLRRFDETRERSMKLGNDRSAM
jgi:hypothetical protein